MQKAVAAYPSCIPQAREATTNRMKWELITGEEVKRDVRRLRYSFRLYD